MNLNLKEIYLNKLKDNIDLDYCKLDNLDILPNKD